MRSYGITNAAPYATAPAVGLAGDTYFDTVAKQLYLSDGTVWIPQYSPGAAWNTAWGAVVAPVLITASGTASNAMADLAGSTITITPVVGRRYKIVAEGLLYNDTANARANIYIRDSANTIYQGGQYRPAYATGSSWQTIEAIWTPGAATTTTFKISYNSTDPGNANIYCDNTYAARIWVEDIGPAVSGITGPGPDIPNYYYNIASSWTYTAGTYTAISWSVPNPIIGSGFTTSGTNITFTKAGKYKISTLFWGYPTANGANAVDSRISHLNSSLTVKNNRDMTGNMPGAANNWYQIYNEAMVDAVVGDVIQALFRPSVASAFAGCYIEIIPIGAQKGDPGLGIPAGGSVGQVLTKKTTTDYDTQWSNVAIAPAAKIHATGSVSTSSEVDIPCTVTDFLRSGFTVSSGHLIVPVTGIYHVIGQLGSMNGISNAGVTGEVYIVLGTQSVVLARDGRYYNGQWATLTVSILASLTAGDTLKISVKGPANSFVDPANGWAQPCSINAFQVST